MADEKILLKNAVLKASDNGGYIVEYEKCYPSKNSYEGICYLGRGEETFQSGTDALARLDAIQADAPKVVMAAIEAKKAKETKDYD